MPYRPKSGSLFFFDKEKNKDFRRDSYEWKKRKDGNRFFFFFFSEMINL